MCAKTLPRMAAEAACVFLHSLAGNGWPARVEPPEQGGLSASLFSLAAMDEDTSHSALSSFPGSPSRCGSSVWCLSAGVPTPSRARLLLAEGGLTRPVPSSKVTCRTRWTGGWGRLNGSKHPGLFIVSATPSQKAALALEVDLQILMIRQYVRVSTSRLT